MKQYRRGWLTLACVGAALFSPHAGFAGAVTPHDVVVLSGLRLASGNIGAAYNAPDPMEAIGCQVVATSTGGFFATCFARDRFGELVRCNAVNEPAFIDAILSLNNDSFLTFGWKSGPECTFILVENASMHERKR